MCLCTCIGYYHYFQHFLCPLRAWASVGGKRAFPPRKFGLGTLKVFCERLFALKRETDKHNIDVAHPGKIYADARVDFSWFVLHVAFVLSWFESCFFVSVMFEINQRLFPTLACHH